MFIRSLARKWREKNISRRFHKCSMAHISTVFLGGASCRNGGSKTNVTIAEHCTIGASFLALFGGKITVGKNTYIGPATSIQAKESITIGNDVIIANNVLLLDNNNHPTAPSARLQMSACQDFLHDELWSWKYASSAPIIIEDNVWIGRDARILKGVVVGHGSIVALGAVVTRDVPPYSVVAGNPARVVKKLPHEEEK